MNLGGARLGAAKSLSIVMKALPLLHADLTAL